MDKDKLIYKLREFYALELYQLDLYQSQIKAMEEPHLQKAYERLAAREQEHVNYYYDKLKQMGVKLPRPIGSVVTFAGFATGKALDLMSLKERYKLGMAVENKAVDMYESFIRMTEIDPQLADLTNHLWYFMVDEELHQYWFKEYLSRLEVYDELCTD